MAMSSRIRDDAGGLFICFCEVAQPETPESESWIIQKFPDSFEEKDILATIPKFVYPCEFEILNVLHFSFVLTNVAGKWTFGFCRHDPKTSTALVFLSYRPWHSVFVTMLNAVADLIRACEVQDLTNFLENMMTKDIPEPGNTLTFHVNDKISPFHCTIPVPHLLPTIPENRNLTEYYNALEPNNMIMVFASMLYERRIVIKSTKLHRLSSCVQAANLIIYPMSWQHIFIPLLPKHLTEYLLAPMPFLIGVPTVTWNSLRKSDIGDLVVLDADTNVIATPFNDVEKLPSSVIRFLKTQLKNESDLGKDGFARTFLRALVQLIGGYRDALKFQQGQKITFNSEAFVESRPQNMQPFLRDMLHLQIFQQFVEERLDMLNAGLGFSDEFEFEAYNYTAKGKGSALNEQYNNWVSNMKKQGSAFFKTVKKKTNPAMRSAVKTVREKGKDVKSAYREIKTRIKKDNQPHFYPQEFDGSSSAYSRTRPLTIGAPPTATSTFKRPKDAKLSVTTSRSNEYVPLSSPTDESLSPPPNEEEAPATPPNLNIDLLGDMHDVLYKQCSLLDSSPPIDRTLKPVASLDGSSLFGRSWEQQVRGPASLSTRIRPNHPPLSKPSWSHPLSPTTPTYPYPSTNPFSFAFQNSNPFTHNPFGFGAFASSTSALCNANDISTSNIVSYAPANNAPYYAPAIRKCNGANDLIRLDSTSANGEANLSRENSDDSIKFKTGLMNPLYPYYSFTKNPDDKNHKSSSRSVNSIGVENNESFVHSIRKSSNVNEQDTILLKEYGIDFQSNSNCRDSTSNNVNSNLQDPFDMSFESTRKNTPSTWATFD